MPGAFRTNTQPAAYGPMRAVTEPDTHTVTIMAGTQVLKTELLINAACYFIHIDPSPILFVQPTQNAAEAFSKERFAPTIDATEVLRELVAATRTRDSENTITHKAYPGGSIDFVGANSPTDLASRPKRIILLDEVDKYPPSAGAEGDPVKLAEERASTYHDVGRAKFIRACSPTEEGTSRIAREYKASDQRKCFVACPHCGFEQTLVWANVVWSRDGAGAHLANSAGILCQAVDCGTIWSESDRRRALEALEHAPDNGWRQMRKFSCCEEMQTPEIWDDRGRSRCKKCSEASPYDGHAGFHVSKLYSKRHRLSGLVREFLEAKSDAEVLRKFTNTALAEVWKPQGQEIQDSTSLISRAENYGPDDLPHRIEVVSGFCDVQGNRLEIQMVGWGPDEEAWPFLFEVIPLDPAQPQAWRELDVLLRRSFRRRDGATLRVAAFGIDTGGHHGAQVYDFCRSRRGRRIFATQGVAGKRPLWPTRSTRSKNNDPLYLIGVDGAKDAIYARLKIESPEPGAAKPGFIHFPAREGFGPDYFEQLTPEVKVTRRRMGQDYSVWEMPKGKRNEVLDTLVGALAVRRSLPRRIERGLEFDVSAPQAEPDRRSGPSPAVVMPPPAKKATFARMLAR